MVGIRSPAPVLLLVAVACGADTTLAPRGPDAYVWKLSSSAEPAEGGGGGFTLAHQGDFVAGEYCEHCLAPLFRTDWCNRSGTGPGWQVRNVEPYAGARRGWVYVTGSRFAPAGYYADVCHDSTSRDLTTAPQHTNDSAAGIIHIRSYSPVTRRYRTYTLAGNNRDGSSLGFVYASGCNTDSTLLWSVADTSGMLYGPFAAPGSASSRAGVIVADEGALRFVREGFKPQCIPAADAQKGSPTLVELLIDRGSPTQAAASGHWLGRRRRPGSAHHGQVCGPSPSHNSGSADTVVAIGQSDREPPSSAPGRLTFSQWGSYVRFRDDPCLEGY